MFDIYLVVKPVEIWAFLLHIVLIIRIFATDHYDNPERGIVVNNKINMIHTFKHSLNGVEQDCCSARELYQALELNIGNYSRFIKANMLDSVFFKENVHYGILFLKKNINEGAGRPTQDYAITIDVAKHLIMMCNTKKAFELREYLISLDKSKQEGELIRADQAEALVELAKYLSAADVRKQMLNAHLCKLASENGGRFDIAQNLRKNLCEIDKPKLIEMATNFGVKNAEKLSVDDLSTAIDARAEQPEYFNVFVAAVDMLRASDVNIAAARRSANSIKIIAKQGNYPDVKYSKSLHRKQPNQKMLLSIINNQFNLLGN